MWSYGRFKGGSRGIVVGGFPNFSLVKTSYASEVLNQNISYHQYSESGIH